MTKSERFVRGWDKLQQIDGEAGNKVINGLKDISPELSRFIIEYSFGTVYSLTSLDNQSKEIVALSSLIAQRAVPEIKVHLNAALNTGLTICQVKEIILQMSVYAGFPKCICGMNTLREVLNERQGQGIIDLEGMAYEQSDYKDRGQQGAQELSLLDPNQEQILRDNFESISPELILFTLEYAYGDIYARNNLDKKYRQIATISALATLGNAVPQLKFHIQAAINIGLNENEIKEIILLMTVYAGFPATINAMNILKEVLSERKIKA
jgi:4-carboxymuconolactone decarboxylase